MPGVDHIVDDDRRLTLGDSILVVLREEQLRHRLTGMFLLPLIQALMLAAVKGFDIFHACQFRDTAGKPLGIASIALVSWHSDKDGLLELWHFLKCLGHGGCRHVHGHAVAVLDTVGQGSHRLFLIIAKADDIQMLPVLASYRAAETVIAQYPQTVDGRNTGVVPGILCGGLQPFHIIPVGRIELRQHFHGFLRTVLMTETTCHHTFGDAERAMVFLFHRIAVDMIQIGIVTNLELQFPRFTASRPLCNLEGHVLRLHAFRRLYQLAVHVLLDFAVESLQLLFQILQLFALLPLLVGDALQFRYLADV